jgi:small ligand-binding sensory domain FIST
MAGSAATFAIRAENPARFAAGALEALQGVARPTAGLVFLSGALAERSRDVAAALGRAELGMPVVIVTGAGVLSERGEIEGQSAGAGLVFSGGRPEARAFSAASTDDAAMALAGEFTVLAQKKNATALVFAQSRGFGVDSIEPFAAVPGLHVAGAGTTGDSPVLVVQAGGQVQEGSIGGLLVRGLTPARIRSSPACKLLMPLRPITAARGPMLVEIGGEPALDVLEAVAHHLEGQPLVLTVLAPDQDEGAAGGRPELLVRGIQGVDPARRAILLSGDLKVGSKIAFAVRDAGAARTDLELVTRELGREAAGAAPLFGVYLNCAGRGSDLYSTADVDLRILRERFPDVPLTGMQSAFEIAPYAGRPAVHFYTGVVALFTMPS